MTNRQDTYEQYLSVCKIHKKPENKLVKIIFESSFVDETEKRYTVRK